MLKDKTTINSTQFKLEIQRLDQSLSYSKPLRQIWCKIGILFNDNDENGNLLQDLFLK